jgi:predicted MFS family arabinose efflux permease
MTPFRTLSAAGFAATAITYGPARMGFGLFLPQFRSAFGVSTQTAGLVSSLGFLAFVSALLVSQAITSRRGPRLPIVAGLFAASAGLALVAAAPNLAVLGAGIVLAMSSAGFSWVPFNNAIHRRVEDAARPAALSAVSTGTSLGIITAGAAALLVGIDAISWRVCWTFFALAGAAALAGNWTALRVVAGSPGHGPAPRSRTLVQPASLPLIGVGLCFGTTSAVYLTFAVDRIAQAGGVAGLASIAAGGVVFLCYGLFGLIGLFTARARAATDLVGLLRLLMIVSALSLALVALAPTSWAGVVLSAGLQGVYVMMTSAVLAFWSDRLFPSLPSKSFTLVLLAVGAGSVIGPAVAGFVSDMVGWTGTFLGTAALSAAAAAGLRSRHVRERPQPC